MQVCMHGEEDVYIVSSCMSTKLILTDRAYHAASEVWRMRNVSYYVVNAKLLLLYGECEVISL